MDGALAPLAAAPDAVGLSVTLTGRTGFGSAALERISREDRDVLHTGTAGTRYFIVNAHLDTRPEIDLEELAGRPDPVGLLAARLLWLDRAEGTRSAIASSAGLGGLCAIRRQRACGAAWRPAAMLRSR